MHNNFVSTAFLIAALFVGANGYKTGKDDPNRPSFIPESYIQIEAGDFETYFEWWATDNKRSLLMSNYKKPLHLIELIRGELDDLTHTQIFPVFDETNYFFLKTLGSKISKDENFDLISFNDPTLSYITAHNGETHPGINEHAFLCRQYWIIDEKRALDTKTMYSDAVSQNAKTPTSPIVLAKPLMKPFESYPNSDCFTEKIKSQLGECFKNGTYCAVDTSSGTPKLVISTQQIVWVYGEAQLIQRFNKKPNQFVPYYVVLYRGSYYYFPDGLKTFSDDKPPSDMKTRIAMLPQFRTNDPFWQRKLQVEEEKKHEPEHGYKTGKDDANRPAYIPENYIQIEANDFTDYYEWWAKQEGSEYRRILAYTEYNNPAKILNSVFGPLYYSTAHHSRIYSIRDENRYVLLISSENKEEDDNYDLVTLNKETTWFINAKNQDTRPDTFEHAFLCRQWWIVNETHALNTRKVYDIAEGNGFAKILVKLSEQISSISNDNCFRSEIMNQLDKCFKQNKYCAMDLDGPEPKLVISDEHVVEVSHGIQLIMRLRNDTGFVNLPYYVLKMKDLYFYFPENLQTGNNVGKDAMLEMRVSLVPKLQFGDRFWQRALRVEREINGGLFYPYGTGNIIIYNPIVYAQNMYMLADGRAII